MNRAIAVSLAALMLAGCYESFSRGGGPPPPPGTEPDAGPGVIMPPPPPPPPPPGEGNTYVIAALSAPPVDFSGRSVGADLDGMDSGTGSVELDATCEEFQPDFVNLFDGRGGVDNAYASLVPTLDSLLGETTVDQQIAEALQSGQLILLLELLDDQAILELGATSEPLRTEADGSLSPGQTFFAIETLGVGPVSTVGGRTEVQLGRLSAPVFVDVVPLDNLERTVLRFQITPAGLENGELAGASGVSEWVSVLARIMPGIEDTLRSVLESVADVEPSDEPSVCRLLSLGLQFRAVPAVRADI